ncbi:hypothetical protein E0485_04230 [Paenibacillus albiflavus]|uniref:Uncharacterized protein n=1 Tax=Paenibacillus albiflavus TaxID=2545760 RepID=A0A4R4ENG8_9BACL|nr:hypothetical protein E0485_04230 [Paenibacillus albiflavus]
MNIVTSIVGIFLTKPNIYTKLNQGMEGFGTTIPNYLLPLFAAIMIFAVERLRNRLSDQLINVIHLLCWVSIIFLIWMNLA